MNEGPAAEGIYFNLLLGGCPVIRGGSEVTRDYLFEWLAWAYGDDVRVSN